MEEAEQLFRLIRWHDIRLLSFDCNKIDILLTSGEQLRVAAMSRQSVYALLHLVQPQ
jgi:hypothetical protein